MYPNNEHENDFANGQGFDFKRVVYAGELSNEEDMEDDDFPSNLLRLVEQDERQILPNQEITEAMNLGIEKERKEVKIGTTLSPATRKELIDLLQEYNDVFAWSYQDMLSLDTDIMVQQLPLRGVHADLVEIKKGQARDAVEDQRRSEETVGRGIP